jgi:hypothetical protein
MAKRMNQPPRRLEGILHAVSQQLQLDQKVQEFAVLAAFERLLPTPVKRVRLKRNGNNQGHTLWVTVADALSAAEMSMSVAQYQDRLNQLTPQTGIVIHSIRVRMG